MKPTKLYVWHKTNKHFLDNLGKRCPGNHTHMPLSAWDYKKPHMRTKDGSSAYPLSLCNTWATLIKRQLDNDP